MVKSDITKYVQIMLCFSIIFSRVMPHPPNMTPLIAFAIFLASQSRYAWIGVLASFLISDILLSLMFHYPLFGLWTVFTYSGMLGVVLFAQYYRRFNILFGFSATLFFWIWTNFGVWLTSNLYPLSSQGLLDCYIAAIPFLVNNLLGTGIGYALLKIVLPEDKKARLLLSTPSL